MTDSAGINIHTLFSQLPLHLEENVEQKGPRAWVVSVRFAEVAYALVGGRGRGVTEKGARLSALRSLSARLCELRVFCEPFLQLVESRGQEAIALFLPYIGDLLQHMTEYVSVNVAKESIVQSWDASQLRCEKEQLTHYMVTQLGQVWDELWRETSLPSHITETPSAESCTAYEGVGGKRARLGASGADGAEIAVIDISSDDEEEVESVVVLPPDPQHSFSAVTLPADPKRAREMERMRGQIRQEKRWREQVQMQHTMEEEERWRMVTEEQKKREEEERRREQEEQELKEEEQAVCLGRTALEEVATMLGTTIEEDDNSVRLADINPSFISTSKMLSNPYTTLVQKLVEWRLLPSEIECASMVTEYTPSLWAVLAPLIAAYGDGTSPDSDWRRREMRDIGERFWRRPTKLELVKFPLPSPPDPRSDEGACQLLVQAVANTAILHVARETQGDLYRLHFVSFPSELFGDNPLCDESSLFCSFVRFLCSSGLLPPWLELIYVLRGEHGHAWRAAIVEVVDKIVPLLTVYYLENMASRMKCGGVNCVRERVRAFLSQHWNTSTVTVPRGVNSEFSLSFRVRDSYGRRVWRSNAPAPTEKEVLARQSVSIMREKKRASCEILEAIARNAEEQWRASGEGQTAVNKQAVKESVQVVTVEEEEGEREGEQTPEESHLRHAQVTQPSDPPRPVPVVSLRISELKGEELHHSCAQAVADLMEWNLLTRQDHNRGEMVYFSGIPYVVVHGTDNNYGNRYHNLMYRLNTLGVTPPWLRGKVMSSSTVEGQNLQCLLKLLHYTFKVNQTSAPVCVPRVANAFWCIAHPPVSIHIFEEKQWTGRREGETAVSFFSRVDKWLLIRIATHARTHLVLAYNQFGHPMVWFSCVAIQRLGVNPHPDLCPFRSLVAHLSVNGWLPSIGDIENETLQPSGLDCMAASASRHVLSMREEERNKEYWDRHQLAKRAAERAARQ